MARRLKRRKKGTLHIIAALLISSATLRMGAGTGEALAESLTSTTDTMADAQQPENDVDKDILLKALLDREERVTERELALEQRLRTLQSVEEDLEEQLAALQIAEESLRATIALADTAAESDLARLTAVYENMKPKEAAALFEEMSPDFSAGFLGMMRPDAAALIMTQLTPQTAYSISVVLAGRNAGVPTE